MTVRKFFAAQTILITLATFSTAAFGAAQLATDAPKKDDIGISSSEKVTDCILCACMDNVASALTQTAVEFKGENCQSVQLSDNRSRFLPRNVERMRQIPEPVCAGDIEKIITQVREIDYVDHVSLSNLSPPAQALVQRVAEEQLITELFVEASRIAAGHETTCSSVPAIARDLGAVSRIEVEAARTSAVPETNCRSVITIARDLGVVARIENATFLETLIETSEIDALISSEDKRVSDALYIATQHSEIFPAVQREILNRRKQLFKEGLGSGHAIAGVIDRLSIRDSKTQKYGTHVRCDGGVARLAYPLSVPRDVVDDRRLELKLRPLDLEMEKQSERCQKKI